MTDNDRLLGKSTYLLDHKVYSETSVTNVAFDHSGSDVKNCYYDHGTYQSDYRHHNRAIGITFKTDTNMLSIGINKHFSDGVLFELVLNHLTLNEDQQNPSPILNSMSEEIIRFNGFYHMHC